MTLDEFGNIYVTGSAGTSSSNIAYLTIKYDNDGNEKWNVKYDGPGYNGYDATSSICIDNSGFVYITGSSAGVSSNSDVATIKYIQAPNDVYENKPDLPTTFELDQNYPNPFNPSTVISYQLPVSGSVTLKVFDVLGNEIATLVDEYKPAGRYEVEFQSTVGSRQLASGIYFYQLRVGSFVVTRKMILLR
ncbi:MAG: T9SS type A sorting domain-containing protein [bacterium]|nr:T9SS type A sorting domain-containing protein [bacterium]